MIQVFQAPTPQTCGGEAQAGLTVRLAPLDSPPVCSYELERRNTRWPTENVRTPRNFAGVRRKPITARNPVRVVDPPLLPTSHGAEGGEGEPPFINPANQVFDCPTYFLIASTKFGSYLVPDPSSMRARASSTVSPTSPFFGWRSPR